MELELDADKSDNLEFEYLRSSALWRYLILKLDFIFIFFVENYENLIILASVQQLRLTPRPQPVFNPKM